MYNVGGGSAGRELGIGKRGGGSGLGLGFKFGFSNSI